MHILSNPCRNLLPLKELGVMQSKNGMSWQMRLQIVLLESKLSNVMSLYQEDLKTVVTVSH